MFVDARWLLAGVALIACASFADEPRGIAAQTSASRAPVVAELFTSEGCSSCPPADDVLTDMVRRQPIPGVEVLALSEHVDYWDSLGWRDRFSNTEFSSRQSGYDERVFRANRIYTPQLVVDGQYEVVGSDAGAVRQAILRAARLPKASVTIGATAEGSGRQKARVNVQIAVPAALSLRSRADVVLAIVEDELTTNVPRGENGGRTLRHTAVARVLKAIGALEQQERAWSGATSVPLGADWAPGHLRAIAFLQERDTRRVVGAAVTKIAAQ